MTPLVSIIIPTLNRAHLISDTLDSVLAQTYTNWECIVVDDGSTDNTEALIQEYINKDNRFRYFNRPKDHLPGGNGARNYGFTVSKGDYIQWFDSDDIMKPEFLEKKLQPFITNNSVDIVFSAFENLNKQGKRARLANQKFSGNILNDLVDGIVSFGPLSFLIKRALLAGYSYDETLTKNQDLDFFFRFFTSQPNLHVEHVSEVLYTVKSHKDSMTYGTSKDISKMASTYRVYLMVLNYFKEHKHTKGVLKYRYHCLNTLKVMLKNGFYNDVLKRLMAFEYISLNEKIYLVGCVFSQLFIKRGSNQFIKLKSLKE